MFLLYIITGLTLITGSKNDTQRTIGAAVLGAGLGNMLSLSQKGHDAMA